MAIDTTIGGTSSDSYATLAEYQAYAVAMGLALAGDDVAQETQLRRARAYIDRVYSWLGRKVSADQSLAWPRLISKTVGGFVVPSDVIPKAIKDAQCEMAAIIGSGTDPLAPVSEGAVVSERKKVDVLEVETKYAEASAKDRASYPAVDNLVADYVSSMPGQSPLSVPLVRG